MPQSSLKGGQRETNHHQGGPVLMRQAPKVMDLCGVCSMWEGAKVPGTLLLEWEKGGDEAAHLSER